MATPRPYANTSYHISSQSGDTVLDLQTQESDEEKSESEVDVESGATAGRNKFSYT